MCAGLLSGPAVRVGDVSTALYRRYRPETFADVIGQEHVTEPLMQALRSGRVNHAYLFSGPRGCGKTTSARILARCLNCEQGPTPEPCGTCDSCVALARDGAGSVDVIEIDAASHGGVDDARDLRERAAFGPAQSRYKVYIIDEAHMVTPNGFNALLKVVEEPPPHVKFIFATTEPEKVLATIRSRTHHYPFHLVPPQRLGAYLEQVCAQEGVALEPGVLTFVTRAGGGSVRDSLSVLDQLISGAGEEGLTYERTAALLGFTDVELLDAVVDAVAAGDAATVFAQVDKVMESGHDPRRFVEDLLERYRDLIVLAAVGGSAAAGGLLPRLPSDQIDRMRHQASVQGAETLSRAADVVSHGLSEMTGAVSFRLMLELLVARLLLPAATGAEGYGARLDRIERRLAASSGAESASRPAAARQPAPQQPAPQQPAPQQVQEAPSAPAEQAPSAPGSGSSPAAPAQSSAPGVLDTAALRRQWPDVLEHVRQISRRTWSGLQMAVLLDYDGRRVLLGMPDENWIRHFIGTAHQEALRQALIESIALEAQVEAVVSGPGKAQAAPEQVGGTDGQRPPADTPPAGTPPGEAPHGEAPHGEPAQEEPPHGEPPPEELPRDGDAPHARPSYDQDPDAHAAPAPARAAAGPPTAPAASGASAPPTPAPGVPAGRGTPAPPLDDRPRTGRIRTRSGQQGAAAGAAPGGAAPARTAAPGPAPSRPGAGQSGPGPAPARSTAGPASPETSAAPSMADQLGTVRRTTEAAGPDWSERTRASEAPAWATADGDDEASPSAPGNASRTPAVAPAQDAAPGRDGDAVAPARREDGDAPSADDEDLATSGLVGQPVIESVLGGTVIAVNDDPVA